MLKSVGARHLMAKARFVILLAIVQVMVTMLAGKWLRAGSLVMLSLVLVNRADEMTVMMRRMMAPPNALAMPAFKDVLTE